MKPILSVLFFIVSVPVFLFAQPPSVKWQKVYGGSGADGVSIAIRTASGGYLLGGNSESNMSGDKTQNSAGSNDYWIVLTDAAGNKLWDKTLGSSGQDNLTGLAETPGGFIISGFSDGGISGDKTQLNKDTSATVYKDDLWIIKVDKSGNKLWDKTYGGRLSDGGGQLLQLPDGSFIVAATSNSGIGGDKTTPNKSIANPFLEDYWIFKIDSNGNKLLDITIGGDSMDRLVGIKKTLDNGYIIYGHSNSAIGADKSSGNWGQFDYWIVKTDLNFVKQWDKTYGGVFDESLSDVLITSDSGYVLIGNSASTISGDKTIANKSAGNNYNYWILKLDKNGSIKWQKVLGGSVAEYANGGIVVKDDGVIISGYSYSGVSGDKTVPPYGTSTGTADGWLVKLDKAGNKLWDYAVGGNKSDYLNSILSLTDSSITLAATSASDISGNKSLAAKGGTDFWLVNMGVPTYIKDLYAAAATKLAYTYAEDGRVYLVLYSAGAARYKLYDNLGRIVDDGSVEGRKQFVQPSGMYYLLIEQADKQQVLKIAF